MHPEWQSSRAGWPGGAELSVLSIAEASLTALPPGGSCQTRPYECLVILCEASSRTCSALDCNMGK